MNPFLMHCASGKSFFTGICLKVISGEPVWRTICTDVFKVDDSSGSCFRECHQLLFLFYFMRFGDFF